MNIAERLLEVSAHYGPVIATVDGFDVIDCQACGFRHIDPLFSEDELKKFYDGEFYESERSDYFTKMEEDKEWWMLRYRHYYQIAGSACARPASSSISGPVPAISWKRARTRGWDVLGFEPSRMACDYTRARGLTGRAWFLYRPRCARPWPV